MTLNSQKLTVSEVAAAGEQLFEITGQFESRVLFNSATHLALLDAFGDTSLESELTKYRQAYRRWR